MPESQEFGRLNVFRSLPVVGVARYLGHYMLWRNTLIRFRIANLAGWSCLTQIQSPKVPRGVFHCLAPLSGCSFFSYLRLHWCIRQQAAEQPFDEWLVELRAEARSKGISDATLDAALNGAAPIARVIELDRNQPEFTLTFAEYLERFVSDWRKKTAARMLVEHADILDAVERKYGVQKRYIVTFWGMETSFGKYLGSFNIPHSLRHWPMTVVAAPISARNC